MKKFIIFYVVFSPIFIFSSKQINKNAVTKLIKEISHASFKKLDKILPPDQKSEIIKELTNLYSDHNILKDKTDTNKKIIILSNPNLQKKVICKKFYINSIINRTGKFIFFKNGNLYNLKNNKSIFFKNLNLKYNDLACFSYNENFLLISIFKNCGSKIIVLNLNNLDQIDFQRFNINSNTKKIDINSNGKDLLLFSEKDNSVHFINTDNLKNSIIKKFSQEISDIKFSPDASIAIIVFKDDGILLFYLKNNDEKKLNFNNLIHCYKVSIQDNSLSLDGINPKNGNFITNLFDLNNLDKQAENREISQENYKLDSPNGNYELKSKNLYSPVLIDKDNPEKNYLYLPIPEHKKIRQMAFANNGKYIIACLSDETIFWDISDVTFSKFSLAETLSNIKVQEIIMDILKVYISHDIAIIIAQCL